MVSRLQAEIRQNRPFGSLEEQVFVNLQRTADALLRGFAEVLKPAGLSPTQYNVLRILRGAGPEGLCCGDIAERMVTRDPDITRLLDRMEARRLIRRTRSQRDRRVVTTEITAEGLKLLSGLDQAIAEFHDRMLAHMGDGQLRAFDALLERARERGESSPEPA